MSDPAHGVSVVIPCFNGSRYVGAAIESVLDQSLPPLELIVVDDGSTDDTPAVLASYAGRVQGLRQAQRGSGAARNHGARVARGRWIAFLDADDLWLPDALERLFAPTEDAGAVWTVGRVRQFVSPDLDPAEAARLKVPEGSAHARAAGAMLLERETFLAVGGFSSAFRAGEFMDLSARLEDAGVQPVSVDADVVRRRLHAANMMRAGRELQLEYLKVLAATRARRRAGAAPPA